MINLPILEFMTETTEKTRQADQVFTFQACGLATIGFCTCQFVNKMRNLGLTFSYNKNGILEVIVPPEVNIKILEGICVVCAVDLKYGR
jgi:hypothetical protein